MYVECTKSEADDEKIVLPTSGAAGAVILLYLGSYFYNLPRVCMSYDNVEPTKIIAI